MTGSERGLAKRQRRSTGRVCAVLAFAASLFASVPVVARTAEPAAPDVRKLFSLAHEALHGGVTFTPATCADAAPLLDQVIALSDPGKAKDGPLVFALLERGYCKLVVGDPAGAASLFSSVTAIVDGPPEGNILIVGNARACLAHLYASGQGVPRDPTRALGLFVLGEGHSCRVVNYDPANEAAQLVLALNPDAAGRLGSLAYHFLRQGGPQDFLAAVKLYQRSVSGNGVSPELMSLAMDGVSARGFTPEAVAARDELIRQLGTWHLEQGRWVQAYGLFLSAGSRAASEDLEAAELRAPFKLIMPNGRHWSPTNEN